ncbi:uncharacterized membrane protein At4g09580-like [Carica papaya]|uniref:uncharacterized membrane protein At4g09580-like n=1 Tax=Carica papaya TaxID=3649 RepID=UPI000B8C9FF5|nr:uncharacterized membrane protein At4g09580-like [Carica papaya]
MSSRQDFSHGYSVYVHYTFPKISIFSFYFLFRDNLASYAADYPVQFILGYCSTYIFMQTFMIPGTIFMSLLAGALFGVVRGIFLVVFNATAGASSCFFLSKLIGRPLVSWLWPDKLRFFQAEIVKRRDKLLNYMLFLRITPTLPNLFINLASPIVDIPFHVFFLATLIGLIPASYITVRVSLTFSIDVLSCPTVQFLSFMFSLFFSQAFFCVIFLSVLLNCCYFPAFHLIPHFKCISLFLHILLFKDLNSRP